MTFYRFIWWLAYGLAVVLFRVRVEGRHHIPQSGALILASNHCSYVDPVIIGVAAGRELWYLAKAELFPIPLLGNLIHKLHAMPVDRSRGDRSAFLAWTRILQAGNPVLIFPEGTRNKRPGFLRPPSRGWHVGLSHSGTCGTRIYFGYGQYLENDGWAGSVAGAIWQAYFELSRTIARQAS